MIQRVRLKLFKVAQEKKTTNSKSFRKNDLETGNHSFHLLLTHLRETRDTAEKIDELACFLLCFPKKQKIRELRCSLDPLISPFRAHGGPVDTPIWTDNSIL